MVQQVPINVFGGPTVLIEYGGLRFLTDPTFDGPGDYELPGGLTLTKTAPSPVAPGDLDAVDAVLLSHDQHADNLDTSGRAFLADVPLTLTTTDGAQRLGGTARGLSLWTAVELPRPDGGTVTVTAVPALHGPEGAEAIAGAVIGFVLTSDDLPTIYVSGDNASLELVRQIADRFGPVDTAVLFAGAPRLPVFDGALVVLDSAMAAAAAQLLGARRVVPAHCDSWAHFTEDRDDLAAAFAAAGVADRLQLG
ncbi:MBL fold metallo-hydrolase [Streptomyces sp. NBC_01637]|uniref:MBL fold metallo-hydrolase n=1 Tax=unclassified Streptomyces TaxID=2593676 RepID=UPI00387040F0|nr:MBL fold metallo-hydrolase [Streptomyces sp. NBC_01653]WTC84536.1 MBL fold metallo-hydrolase [Streptomyces sp. NBC_01653]WTD86331.1 MBL fold metallo-hydrolase [Streptomyces sp. NBC_01637]WTD94193.1 MBL fold metallo-hydrolase [Streptomyces sp. NBC_01637]